MLLLQVLHLARDPRGVLSSRDEIGVDDALHTKHEVRSIRSTCRRVVAGLQYVSSTHEFDNKYKLVRYVMLSRRHLTDETFVEFFKPAVD